MMRQPSNTLTRGDVMYFRIYRPSSSTHAPEAYAGLHHSDEPQRDLLRQIAADQLVTGSLRSERDRWARTNVRWQGDEGLRTYVPQPPGNYYTGLYELSARQLGALLSASTAPPRYCSTAVDAIWTRTVQDESIEIEIDPAAVRLDAPEASLTAEIQAAWERRRTSKMEELRPAAEAGQWPNWSVYASAFGFDDSKWPDPFRQHPQADWRRARRA